MTNEATVTDTEKKKAGPKEGAREVIAEFPAVLVGRDKKPIRREEVYRLAALGCKNFEICNWLGVDDSSLQYNFKVELLTGREAIKQSLRQKQIEVALSGNPTMLIWLGKNMLGQKDAEVLSDEAKVLPWNKD